VAVSLLRPASLAAAAAAAWAAAWAAVAAWAAAAAAAAPTPGPVGAVQTALGGSQPTAALPAAG